MARVFCENCGRQRRAVEAVGAYEGTPYCEPCKKGDDIPEQDFVRFGGQSAASDAGSRSQVATPEAAASGYVVYDPQKATATAKHRCVDCGTVVRVRRGTVARSLCRKCEKNQKALIDTSKPPRVKWQPEPKQLSEKVRAFAKLPPVTLTEGVIVKVDRKNKTITVDPLAQRKPWTPNTLALLSDDDYQKLKPHAAHNDLARQLLAQIGMIVAVKGPKQGRVKLDAKRGDTRNLAMRIRRLLRSEKIAAEVEAFQSASCIVVSVGYGKQAK